MLSAIITYYFIGLISYYLYFYYYVRMFMLARYCVCMHNCHSAHICNVYNRVKCVCYSYNQVNS